MEPKMKILVVKDVQGKLYHLRMDKPFERPLARLMTLLVDTPSEESPQSIASVWLEFMSEEEYQMIDSVVFAPSVPSFITSNE